METNILRDLGPIEIQKYQQNRYPCFFLDKITEVIPGKSAKGFKNFTYNEWFFPPHFVDEPNVPNFVQTETLEQCFLMTFLSLPDLLGKKAMSISIDHARFYKMIIPGDRLDIESILNSYRRGIAKGVSKGYVNGILACEIETVVCVPDILNQFKPVK